MIEAFVSRREREAEDIISLELSPVSGEWFPPFEPGAHIDLHLGTGLVRQSSLCNDPYVAGKYRIGVLLDPASRGGSAAVHSTLKTGTRLRISRPRNNFPIVPGSRAILLAGGIGITPLLAMTYRLRREEKEFRLHYFVRTRSRAAFISELESLRENLMLHIDNEVATTAFQVEKALALGFDSQLYICGPNGFMDAMIGHATRLGWQKDRIHLERFAAHPGGGDGFQVEAVRSGRILDVRPNQTIMDALREAGMKPLVSCEQGVCGTCLTRVLEGTPDHRDEYQSDSEKATNEWVAICCSRSKSAVLRLDL